MREALERRQRRRVAKLSAEHEALLLNARLLIRPSNWEEWLDWRRAMLTETYGQSMDRIAHEWRIEKSTGAQLVFKDRDGRAVRDIGHVVTATRADAKEIRLMLDLAELKGWKRIDLLGDESYRLRAAIFALRRGFQLNDSELEGQARALMASMPQPAPVPEPKADTHEPGG